jgi:hypothetical protein
MAMLNKKNLNTLTLKTEVVELGNDTQIKLRELSLKQQLENESTGSDSKLFIYTMLMNCCIDEDGNQLFSSHDEIESLPADVMTKIFKACLIINHLSDGKLEDLAKN